MAKYMLIMRGTGESVAKMMETPFEQMLETVGRFNEEMIRAGVLVAAEGLDDPTQGVVVDFSGETPVVADGPYGETKELFGGFYVIDVASTDHAGEEDDRRGGSAVRAAAVRGTAAAARRCRPQRAVYDLHGGHGGHRRGCAHRPHPPSAATTTPGPRTARGERALGPPPLGRPSRGGEPGPGALSPRRVELFCRSRQSRVARASLKRFDGRMTAMALAATGW